MFASHVPAFAPGVVVCASAECRQYGSIVIAEPPTLPLQTERLSLRYYRPGDLEPTLALVVELGGDVVGDL